VRRRHSDVSEVEAGQHTAAPRFIALHPHPHTRTHPALHQAPPPLSRSRNAPVAPLRLRPRARRYLLEKVRLIKQHEGERNYHVFYQLLKGSSDAERTELQLGAVADYHYLNRSGCVSRKDGDDGEMLGGAWAWPHRSEGHVRTVALVWAARCPCVCVSFAVCEVDVRAFVSYGWRRNAPRDVGYRILSR
jgi:hypothetical protein